MAAEIYPKGGAPRSHGGASGIERTNFKCQKQAGFQFDSTRFICNSTTGIGCFSPVVPDE